MQTPVHLAVGIWVCFLVFLVFFLGFLEFCCFIVSLSFPVSVCFTSCFTFKSSLSVWFCSVSFCLLVSLVPFLSIWFFLLSSASFSCPLLHPVFVGFCLVLFFQVFWGGEVPNAGILGADKRKRVLRIKYCI